MSRSQRLLLGTFAVLTLSFPIRASADDTKPGDSKPSAPAASTTEEKKSDNSLREQDIYIPYDKLRSVFEKHGRGVYLPYEKFEELWKAAQDKTRPAAAPRPPVGAVITEIESEATVAKDVVQVTAHLKIDVLSEGWHEVPLRLADAAISRATIKNEPARILGGANEEHRLLIEHKGKQPEQIELELEYARAISRAPGENSVAFQAPQAAVSRWKVRIPQSGVKVSIRPMIAATEVPPPGAKTNGFVGEVTWVALPTKTIWINRGRADGLKPSTRFTVYSEEATDVNKAAKKGEIEVTRIVGAHSAECRIVNDKPNNPMMSGDRVFGVLPDDAGGETVLLAFVGAAPTVEIDWTPKSEGATGLTALASVHAEQVLWVQEGITRVHTNLVYSISRAELKELSIEVPADYKVVNVFDPNVRQWAIAAAAGGLQKITAQLFEPAKATQAVVVELEKIAGQKRQETLAVPVVTALNVGRQQGFVVAQVSSSLRAEAAKTSGLLQIDASELPADLRSTPWTFAYRFASAPYVLELSLEEVQPRITVKSLVEVRLEPEKLAINLKALYNIERAGVFKLELDVPEGFEVRGVHGALGVIGGYANPEIESHHLEGAKKTHLVVRLARKALGRIGLQVELARELHDPNLATPTGKKSEIEVSFPQPSQGTVEHSDGGMIVQAPAALRVDTVKAAGLRPVSFPEAMQGFFEAAPTAGVQSVFAFIFTDEPINLQLSAERRKPYVTIRQGLVARIEEGQVKYQATFHYSIQYSGVKSLRIDVPAGVVPRLPSNAPGAHWKTVEPPPAEIDKDMVAWSFSGESELLGDGQFTLLWEQKLDKLDVGKPKDLSVPRLVPRDIDFAKGQIVLVKAETLAFQEGDDLKGLRPIDPQRELMDPVEGAARAFAFEDEWSLPVTVTRYELEDVKRTSIDRAVCRMVITPAGEIAVQALYRIQSVLPRLSVQLPAGYVPDSDPVRINGQPVTLQKGKNDALVVPLVNASADVPFVLEVRYAIPKGQPLTPPAFLDGAAVQKVYLCTFVPAVQDVIGTSGSWSEDFRWVSGDDGRWIPLSPFPLSHDQRVAWVCEGNPAAGNAAGTFHFDGTPLTFSTLRPDATNTVGLWTIDHRALGGWVFGLTLLAGVVLVRARLRTRFVAVAALIVALVVAGVFWPTLAIHVLGPPLYWAIVTVLLIWIVSAPFLYARRIRAFNEAIQVTWTQWVASNQAAATASSEPAALASQPSAKNGGTSHE